MNNKRKFRELLKIAVIFLSIFTFSCTGFDTKINKPNIIYILADDLGYGDVSCLNPESKIQTPHIDRLAQQGITFTDAHTPSGVCTPTRYGILTGRYPWRSTLKSGVLSGFSPPLIRSDRMTVPKLLKKVGYYTACVGKWHLGWEWGWSDKPFNGKKYYDYPERLSGLSKFPDKEIDFTRPITNGPTTRGLDYFYGICGSLDMAPYVNVENDMPVTSDIVPNRDEGRPGPAMQGVAFKDYLPLYTEKACQTIEKAAEQSEPFFLYFPLTAPHTPIVPNEQFIGKSDAGDYGDFVVEVDWTVGKILETVEKVGIADHTLIIFTSDNGPERFMHERKEEFNHYSAWHFRGCKRDNWEGGHRVPFFVRWPGKVKPGTTTDQITCLTDLMATCAAIVGVELPENAGEDSFNLLPIILEQKFKSPARETTVHASSQGLFAIRQGRWKLLMHQGSGGNRYTLSDTSHIQLYDIEADPEEVQNSYLQNPEIVTRLQGLLKSTISQGRSTPGPPQKNDGEEIWEQIAWIEKETDQ